MTDRQTDKQVVAVEADCRRWQASAAFLDWLVLWGCSNY